MEEPVHPDDVNGSLAVKAATTVPIASGENEFTRWGNRELIEKRAVDILQVDPAICGGYSEIRKIAAMASAYHIAFAPHGGHILGSHAAAAFSNGLIVESYPSWFDYPAYDVLKWIRKPVKIKDSYIELSQSPGLGLEIDEEKIRRYEVSAAM